METETRTSLTCQEIVDLYWLKKDYVEMTKQIDLYNPAPPNAKYSNAYQGVTDFFYDLEEELTAFQIHTNDWEIFVGIVKEYHMEKADQKEKENTNERLAKEELLLKFAVYLIEGIEIFNMDEEQMNIQINSFFEDMED